MSNFWTPQNMSTYAARQAEQAQQRAAAEQAAAEQAAAAQRTSLVENVGPAVVAMVRRYTDAYVRADYEQVQRDFLTSFPGASRGDFNDTVNSLMEAGHLATSQGPEGLMGVRSVYLYAA